MTDAELFKKVAMLAPTAGIFEAAITSRFTFQAQVHHFKAEWG